MIMKRGDDKVGRGLYYPTGDRVPRETMQRLYGRPISIDESIRLGSSVVARWTGEKRPPRAGEWFLSGAEVHAYRAENDLSSVYHIAELGLIEERRIVETSWKS